MTYNEKVSNRDCTCQDCPEYKGTIREGECGIGHGKRGPLSPPCEEMKGKPLDCMMSISKTK